MNVKQFCKNILKIVCSIILFIILLLIFAILFFYVWFSLPVGTRATYSLILLFAFLFIYFVILNLIWKIIKNVKIKYTIILLSLSFILFGVINISKYIYDVKITSVEEKNLDYFEYNIVATDSKISQLKEPSMITFVDNIPKMDGATALYPIYAAFAKATYPLYAQNHDYVACRNTINAYDRIIDGDLDIIFVSSPNKEQEMRAKEKDVNLEFIPIGKEAFVFIVNKKNPINNLQVSDIKKIYSGEYKNWNELGIYGLGKIRAFQRADGSGSQTALEMIMGDTLIMTKKKEEYQDFMSGVIYSIAAEDGYKNYSNAIGYSFRFYATQMVTSDKIKLLSIDGVLPTIDNIKNGTYPFASEFYAVVRDDCSAETRKLIDFALSEQGQYLIEDTGYVRIN